MFSRFDYPRYRQRTWQEQIRWTLSYPYWWLLRKLANAGFIHGKTGEYLRLHNFTVFFWRTLVDREREILEAKFAYELDTKIREAADEREKAIWDFLVRDLLKDK